MKKIILISLAVVIVIISIYFVFFKNEKSKFVLGEVVKMNISQELSVTGRVERGDKISLGFNDSGKIEKVYVTKGEIVKKENILAKLENVQLSIKLREANESLSLAQVKLDKLLAGSTNENIKVAETLVSNAQVALENAEQNLIDVNMIANLSLDNSYKDSLNALEASYLEIYDTFNLVDLIQETYFNQNNQEGIKVKDSRNSIQTAMLEAKYYLDIIRENYNYQNIDNALEETEKLLKTVSSSLEVIRDICEEPSYKNQVSSTDKGYLDIRKKDINTCLANIVNSEQGISVISANNQSSINTAQASVSVSQGVLENAQRGLDQIIAPPREEDVNSDQAQINQAQANVDLLKKQIQDTYLISPIDGQIIEVDYQEGELVSSGARVFSLLSDQPFQIEVDIPEVDIGELELGNNCLITLDAFPEIELNGQVIEIDPAETVIQGVVYYKIKVSINNQEINIKQGMTANVLIIVNAKDNVLTIPLRAVVEREDKKFVKIPSESNKENFEEKEIEIGLKDSMGNVEIISGLGEGEKFILFIDE